MSLDAPSLYGFASLLLALASFMSRLSPNGTKMAAKQHQTHFLPIQQSPTEKLLPANNPGWKPWLSLSCVSLMQTVTVEGLESITSRLSGLKVWAQRGTGCKGKHGALPVEEIQARQGKSNTDVRLGLQTGCVREQHLSSLRSWA